MNKIRDTLGDDQDAPSLGSVSDILRVERQRSVRRGSVLYGRQRASAALVAIPTSRVLSPRVRQKMGLDEVEP